LLHFKRFDSFASKITVDLYCHTNEGHVDEAQHSARL